MATKCSLISSLKNQKLQKKMAKRDQAAMLVAQHDSDVSKVCQVLELQALMDNLSEDVRVDFLNGSNGAVVCLVVMMMMIEPTLHLSVVLMNVFQKENGRYNL